METQDQPIARIKEQVAAEKKAELEAKLKNAQKAGLKGKAFELYKKALTEKQSLTLVPAGKAPKQTKGGEDTGNHVVEVELVDGKPIEVEGMIVDRAK